MISTGTAGDMQLAVRQLNVVQLRHARPVVVVLRRDAHHRHWIAVLLSPPHFDFRVPRSIFDLVDEAIQRQRNAARASSTQAYRHHVLLLRDMNVEAERDDRVQVFVFVTERGENLLR